MNRHSVPSRYSFSMALAVIGFVVCPLLQGQVRPDDTGAQAENSVRAPDAQAEGELRTGVNLTRRGLFAEAIPHFLTAKGRVSDEFVAEFNLALCYIGTADFSQAIQVLDALRHNGKATANVENLLAQAYVGSGQSEEAFAALQRAAKLTPKDEKLYVFVSDACGDRQDYVLGLRIVDLGLQHLPNSARLHFQRANYLANLDHLDSAQEEFDLASSLQPHTEVAFDAGAQKNFLSGNLPEAIQIARSAVQEHHANYLTLAILGDALLRAGATPGQPEFTEAESALKESVAARPNYARSQIAMGYLFLLDEKPAEAVQYLEKGRQLDPRNPSVYRHLARAYRKLGKPEQAQEMLATLADLNAQEAQKINSAPGERKAIPGRDHTYP
ncbi:MAG: tetratricopeptide repeat protein [Candidatus Acidiferrales bacterium]